MATPTWGGRRDRRDPRELAWLGVVEKAVAQDPVCAALELGLSVW